MLFVICREYILTNLGAASKFQLTIAFFHFYPSIGNHDNTSSAYFNFFQLPGNEEYYQVTRGPIEFFILNSDQMSSTQSNWVQNELQNSTATYQIVVFHHPPYSSAEKGNQGFMDLNYAGWGADVVLTGHAHSYERILRNGIVYFVNGLGGRSLDGWANCCVSGSQVRYNSNFGAMRVTGDASSLLFRFYNRNNNLIDSYTVTVSGPDTEPPTAPTNLRFTNVTENSLDLSWNASFDNVGVTS